MQKRVLIAEDEPNIVLTLEFLLEQAGYAVAAVAGGKDALAMLQTTPFDLVVLDVMLPDVSGFEVCGRVRADPKLAATRIVMLTAKGGSRDIERGLARGADAYVTKPFATRELMATIRSLLGE